jgi:hypothetical protein
MLTILHECKAGYEAAVRITCVGHACAELGVKEGQRQLSCAIHLLFRNNKVNSNLIASPDTASEISE